MKFQIANLRKRKVAHDKQLTKLTSKNEKLQEETERLKDKNDRDFENIENIDMKFLSQKKELGQSQEKQFQKNRDQLEDQYHKIIETKKEEPKKEEVKNEEPKKEELKKEEPKKEEEMERYQIKPEYRVDLQRYKIK